MSKTGPKPRSVESRFWLHVQKADNGCWIWTAQTTTVGYGRLFMGTDAQPRVVDAHRVSWALFVGPIPDDAFVLHRCDNR
jgi:HNH endonuclease